MKPLKVIQDRLIKLLSDSKMVPEGLVELERYFRRYEPIHFNYHKEDGSVVAVSENFHYGSIVTSAKSHEELDAKIKDAILTAFEIPSAYAKEAGLHRIGEAVTEYAPA
jgi:hypothetical protein